MAGSASISRILHRPAAGHFTGERPAHCGGRLRRLLHLFSYFASETVSQASDPASWQRLADWAHGHGKDFIASVGPGYNDSKIRPWNSGASRDRQGGGRYRRQWRAGIDSGADAVSITSFNEWSEGTQIEPAADSYEDYIRVL